MHTNDPNGSGKCLRRDSDDEICGFQVGAMTAYWKGYGRRQEELPRGWVLKHL